MFHGQPLRAREHARARRALFSSLAEVCEPTGCELGPEPACAVVAGGMAHRGRPLDHGGRSPGASLASVLPVSLPIHSGASGDVA